MFGDNRYHGPQQLDSNEDEIDVVGQPDEGNYNTVRIPGHSGPFLTGKVRDIHYGFYMEYTPEHFHMS